MDIIKSRNLSEIIVKYQPKIKASEREKIDTSNDAYKIFKEVWDSIEYVESFVALYLNRANKILGWVKISHGGISGTVADPKIIIQIALKANSSSLILTHNHPSGNKQPSDADIKLTRKIKSACEFLDLSLLDHLIVTDESYYSFADEGVL